MWWEWAISAAAVDRSRRIYLHSVSFLVLRFRAAKFITLTSAALLPASFRITTRCAVYRSGQLAIWAWKQWNGGGVVDDRLSHMLAAQNGVCTSKMKSPERWRHATDSDFMTRRSIILGDVMIRTLIRTVSGLKEKKTTSNLHSSAFAFCTWVHSCQK